MVINEKIISKYQQMKAAGLDADYLDLSCFGRLQIFINKKPAVVLFQLEIEGDRVYVGSDSDGQGDVACN
jgi:hypothetical protein